MQVQNGRMRILPHFGRNCIHGGILLRFSSVSGLFNLFAVVHISPSARGVVRLTQGEQTKHL